MTTEIVTTYLNQSDAEAAHLEQGWYFETDETDVPQGPYPSQYAAEQAALKYEPED